VNAETWKTFDEFLKVAKTKTMVGGLSGGHSTLGGLVTADLKKIISGSIRF
jgi:hypothetical protein